MKLDIKFLVLSFFLSVSVHHAFASSIEDIIKEAAKKNNYLPSSALINEQDDGLANVGEKLFDSHSLILNGETPCRSCHLEEFSSTDGIPNAIGVGGVGMGYERVMSSGAIIPRNTLALWGRGGIGFEVMFWDGRVDYSSDEVISQFGAKVPSEDILITSNHLPVLEIREMIIEDKYIKDNKGESLTNADNVLNAIVENLRKKEPELAAALAKNLGKTVQELRYVDIAHALAVFIRDEFQIRPTKFEEFVFEEGKLTDQEFKGAQIFYGKGKCASCHSGPYFSDFSFHTIPLPQAGYGKNGFGVDYGRFNVTHNPKDLYKFRTPPLHNVTKTGPYGHSGSIADLSEVIIAHFDPLKSLDASKWTNLERTEYYKKMLSASEDMLSIASLSDSEIDQLVSFLATLEF